MDADQVLLGGALCEFLQQALLHDVNLSPQGLGERFGDPELIEVAHVLF